MSAHLIANSIFYFQKQSSLFPVYAATSSGKLKWALAHYRCGVGQVVCRGVDGGVLVEDVGDGAVVGYSAWQVS